MKQIHVLISLDPRLHFDRCVLSGIAQWAEAHPEVYLDAKSFDESFADALSSGIHAGVIAAPTSAEQMDFLTALNLPCVNVANHLHAQKQVPVVGNDDEIVGQMVAAYYLSRGFRHFAYYLDNANDYFNVRRDSFRKAVLKAGASCDLFPSATNENERHGAMEHAASWLKTLPKPVGVLAPFDANARQVVEACNLAGLRVPEEVSVIGVDNDPFYCVTVRPTVSSVATAAQQIGYIALKELLAIIAGEPKPAKPILIPPTEIIERSSTAEAAITDPDVAAAIHYIRANLRHRLTVSNISEQVAVSRRTLERKFADTLGHSPLEELRRLRVEQAKRMLAHTDLELTEVARLSGLAHAARLSNLIKRFTGYTPRQFRLKNTPRGQ